MDLEKDLERRLSFCNKKTLTDLLLRNVDSADLCQWFFSRGSASSTMLMSMISQEIESLGQSVDHIPELLRKYVHTCSDTVTKMVLLAHLAQTLSPTMTCQALGDLNQQVLNQFELLSSSDVKITVSQRQALNQVAAVLSPDYWPDDVKSLATAGGKIDSLLAELPPIQAAQPATVTSIISVRSRAGFVDMLDNRCQEDAGCPQLSIACSKMEADSNSCHEPEEEAKCVGDSVPSCQVKDQGWKRDQSCTGRSVFKKENAKSDKISWIQCDACDRWHRVNEQTLATFGDSSDEFSCHMIQQCCNPRRTVNLRSKSHIHNDLALIRLASAADEKVRNGGRKRKAQDDQELGSQEYATSMTRLRKRHLA